MPRTVIPIQTLPVHGGVDNLITWTAASAANDHYFENTGKELLLMRSTAVGAKSATVISVADPYNRTGDTAMAPDGDTIVAIAGPFNPVIWNQIGADAGHVHVDLTVDANIEFAVVRWQNPV
jgi:hypothetical protein